MPTPTLLTFRNTRGSRFCGYRLYLPWLLDRGCITALVVPLAQRNIPFVFTHQADLTVLPGGYCGDTVLVLYQHLHALPHRSYTPGSHY